MVSISIKIVNFGWSAFFCNNERSRLLEYIPIVSLDDHVVKVFVVFACVYPHILDGYP